MTGAPPPSIHTRAALTWCAIFPLVTLGSFALAPFGSDWHPVLRTFVLTLVVVPLAVYVVVPQLLRLQAAWAGRGRRDVPRRTPAPVGEHGRAGPRPDASTAKTRDRR